MAKTRITTLKGEITKDSLEIGDMYINLYKSKGRGISCALFLSSTVNELTLEGAYFCVGITDSTPLHGTIEDSRFHEFNNYQGRLYIYFEQDKARLKVSNCKNFIGMGIDPNFANYPLEFDIDDNYLQYCQLFKVFSAVRHFNPNTVVSKEIQGISYDKPVNLSGYKLSSNRYLRLDLLDLSGSISLNNYVGSNIYLKGDYSVDISNVTSGNVGWNLLSPNVSGTYNNATQLQVCCIGTPEQHCSVTFNTSLTNLPATKEFKIFSDGINLTMLGAIATLYVTNIANVDSNLIFVVESNAIDMTELHNSAGIVNNLRTLANYAANIEVTVNGVDAADL